MLLPLRLDADAPWRRRFHFPSLFGAHIAGRNPERGVVIGNFSSPSFQLYRWSLRTGALEQATRRPNGLYEGVIDPDGRYLYYLEDDGGNELGHLVRIPYAAAKPSPADQDLKTIEDLTPDLRPYTLRGVGFSGDGRQIALNPVNEDGFQLVVASLAADGRAGPARRVYTQPQEAWRSLLSYDGALAAMISTARAGGQRRYSTIVLATTDGQLLNELWDGLAASVEAIAFSPQPGDTRLLAQTSRSGYMRPLIWDPVSGQRIDFGFETLAGEMYPLDWSPDGKAMLLCQINRAQQQLFVYDIEREMLRPVPHPPGAYVVPDFGGSMFMPDGRILAIWDSSEHPTQVVALNPDSGKVEATLVGAAPAITGVPLRSVEFPSADGVMVQAWLGVPAGIGPFPTILHLHGGPHYVATDLFSPVDQAWLDHGFAVCSVNYRGSTTFGRAFKEQIWGDVGHWEVEDVLAARRWLIERRIADPQAIILSGESYGGYLTLLTLGQFPEGWAGGISVVGTADVVVDYEDANDALKAAIAGWYGGTPAQKPELYRRSSPITYAEQVQAPILAFHGQNDTRVGPRQMHLYESRLRALGKPIEVVWFDAGHGAFDADRMAEFMARMLQFAYRVVGRGVE